MTEVLIPYGDKPGDTATLLLARAEDLGYEPWIVRNQPEEYGFRVPEDVAEAVNKTPEKKAEPKKAPAKKAPAKKAAAKKTAAKKTANKE